VAAHVSRLDGAIAAVRQAVATACGLPLEAIEPDDDFISDICLDSLEIESFCLIVEELFGARVPEELFRTPLYRTAAAFAEWIIERSKHAAWAESRNAGAPQRRAAGHA
jgi:acyl carrier protein